MGVEVVVRTADSKLAGPEELTVALRPLAEPLDGPSEGVLGVVADLCPWRVRYSAEFYNLSVLPAPRLAVYGWEDGRLVFFAVVHIGNLLT